MARFQCLLGLVTIDAVLGVLADPTLCSDASSCPAAAAHLPDATMRAAMQDIEHPGADRETANMLQRRAAAKREVDVPVDLQTVLPLSWLHIPKCGTSFLNAIVHLPGVCPTVPQDLQLTARTFQSKDVSWLDVFAEEYNVPASCPGLADKQWAHTGLDMRKESLKGHFVTMLRKPEQRMLGTYKDIVWAVQEEPLENLLSQWRSWGGLAEARMPTLQEWMSFGGGCMTRMLTRKGMPCGGKGGPPTAAEIALAKTRLREDFAFVGLTDDWPLSMCLFGATFDVPCQRGWFIDNRDVRPDDTVPYDETELNGTKDVYDAEVYAEAVRLFTERAAKLNVTEASCRKKCWEPAGVVGKMNRTKTTETISMSDWMEVIQDKHYNAPPP